MANAKITALTSNTAAAGADVIPIVDDPSGSPVTQKITVTDLFTSRTHTGTLLMSGGGITLVDVGQVGFPASQSSSAGANTLDDYEEGQWTPVLTAATPGNLSVVYSVQAGRYVKIGRFVMAICYIQTSTWTHTTASGNLQITGLPFTSTNENPLGSGAVRNVGYTKANYTQLTATVTANTTTVVVLATGSAQTSANLVVTDCTSGTQQTFQFTVNYFASA